MDSLSLAIALTGQSLTITGQSLTIYEAQDWLATLQASIKNRLELMATQTGASTLRI